MSINLLLDYLAKGFSLANRNLVIYLIGLLLVMASFIPSFLGTSLIGKVLSFITIPLFFINLGFWVSIPLFLTDKQQNKPINYQRLVDVILRNTKRLIIPGILLLVLVAVLGFVLLLIAAQNVAGSGGDSSQLITSIQNTTQNLTKWNPIMAILAGLFSFSVFTPSYFSLEDRGFLESIKRSAIFSLKNLNYFAIVFLIYTIYYSISSLFPLPFKVPLSVYDNLGLLIRTVLGQYIFFITIASSLLYYQSKTKIT